MIEEKSAATTPTAASRFDEDAPVDRTLVIQLTELWERLLNLKPIAVDDDFSDRGRRMLPRRGDDFRGGADNRSYYTDLNSI